MSSVTRWLFVLGAIVLGALGVGLVVATRDHDRELVVARDREPVERAPAPPPVSDAAIAAVVGLDAVVVAPGAAADRAAGAEREALLAALRESGGAHEEWEGQGRALLGAVRDADAGAIVDGIDCFVAGCGATYTFRSQAAARGALDALAGSAAYRAWTGGKRLSPPQVLGDGSVVIALVLYRPD